MIPIFSHTEIFDDIHFWNTTDAKCGVLIKLQALDSEARQSQEVLMRFSQWIKRQPPNILIRIISQSEYNKEFEIGSSRDKAISEIGFVKREVVLSIETHLPNRILSKITSRTKMMSPFPVIAACIEDLRTTGAIFELLDESAFSDYFPHDPKNWVVCESFVDRGTSYQACVRITRPAANEIFCDGIQGILKCLPRPFQFHISLQKVSKSESQFYLNRKISQSRSGNSQIDQYKQKEMETASLKTTVEGDDLFRTEIVIVLTRTDLQQLKNDLLTAKNILSNLGDSNVETYGALPTIGCSMIGSSQHIPFLEFGINLSNYLPIIAQGSARALKSAKSIFPLHRVDDTVDTIDLLATEHQNANAVVIGSSGRGKSAFVGSLTKSLHNDPNVRIIKVDVGGSHSKECELLGGVEHRITMNSPSGINPFALLRTKDLNENIRSILTNFLAVLVLAENETCVPKAVKIELDELLQKYLNSNPDNPCLNELFQFASEFSRRNLLSRWCGSGVFSKAFSDSSFVYGSTRLRYYNFTEIFQAADPDYAQAGMAAVLAQFNLEMQTNPDTRIVLICDETPFFIQKCFDFFKFSTANVRKFGASIIVVVQMSRNLIVNEDTGIIENSFHRILMSTDGDETEYQKRFRLSDKEIERLRQLRTSPGEYSEFLYQHGDESFSGRLRLTADEYYQVTTSPAEKTKIQNLRLAIPDLTLREAISCLAI